MGKLPTQPSKSVSAAELSLSAPPFNGSDQNNFFNSFQNPPKDAKIEGSISESSNQENGFQAIRVENISEILGNESFATIRSQGTSDKDIVPMAVPQQQSSPAQGAGYVSNNADPGVTWNWTEENIDALTSKIVDEYREMFATWIAVAEEFLKQKNLEKQKESIPTSSVTQAGKWLQGNLINPWSILCKLRECLANLWYRLDSQGHFSRFLVIILVAIFFLQVHRVNVELSRLRYINCQVHQD